MNKIALLASGSGSNAQKIMEYFSDNVEVEVSIVLTNNPEAFVIQRADNFEIPTMIFDKKDLYDSDTVLNQLLKLNINLLVLAGFMWLIPKNIIEAFPNKIINIHPALLPKYGGKGMYGLNVHKAVHEAQDKDTGITIHYVNENYDEGDIIHQAKCKINLEDTAEIIAYKVRKLEHQYFPKIIEKLLF